MKPITLTPEFLAAHAAFGKSANSWRAFADYPGYQTDGLSIVYVGEEAAARATGTRIAPGKATMFGDSRVPLVEDVLRRVSHQMPAPDTRPTCATCRGDGYQTCDLGEEHSCSNRCDDGVVGARPFADAEGARYYTCPDGRVRAVADWMAAHLMEGLTPVLLDDGREAGPIAGVDDAGDIVVIVAGLRL